MSHVFPLNCFFFFVSCYIEIYIVYLLLVRLVNFKIDQLKLKEEYPFICKICILSENIKFTCTRFRHRQKSEHLAAFVDGFAGSSNTLYYFFLEKTYVYCELSCILPSKKSLNRLQKFHWKKSQSQLRSDRFFFWVVLYHVRTYTVTVY